MPVTKGQLRRLCACAVLLGGCALQPQASPDAAPSERDRRAILAMLGEYDVSFDFHETVALEAGYQPKPSKRTEAHETVVLVSDDGGGRIVLQHLLVGEGGHVTKHWRQDWHYQAPGRLEFTEDQTWRLRPLPAQHTRGAWTQCVYEVSDAPRYCGTAAWSYAGDVATWTSDPTWRPLPRREYTTRSDYNALRAINRHSIVPGGWTHEQDNTKVLRAGERVQGELVREFGFNDYRRSSGYDFKPAYDYWQATAGYWARVRALWDARIAAGGVQLKTGVDGMELIVPLFGQAARVQQGEAVADQEIAAAFERWVGTPAH